MFLEIAFLLGNVEKKEGTLVMAEAHRERNHFQIEKQ